MIESISQDKCTGCGMCADVCPLDTIRIDPFQKEMAPCQVVCPAGVDMRTYIHYLKLGMQSEAQKVISMYLPFPSITGRLCHHPCINGCAREDIDEAVTINALERYLGDSLLADKISIDQPVTHAARVAVIGSGPMGLSSAYFLQRLGYRAEVFESDSHLGGM